MLAVFDLIVVVFVIVDLLLIFIWILILVLILMAPPGVLSIRHAYRCCCCIVIVIVDIYFETDAHDGTRSVVNNAYLPLLTAVTRARINDEHSLQLLSVLR